MKERTVQIHFRATEKERIRFQANAKKCGLSLSEYLRKLADGYDPKALPPLEYQQIYDLLIHVYADWRSGGDPRLANNLLDIVGEMMAAIHSEPKGRDENGDNKNLAGAG
jgi:hypothetical protein